VPGNGGGIACNGRDFRLAARPGLGRDLDLDAGLVQCIRAAVEARARRTPVVPATPAGSPGFGGVWLKLEHRQVTGSFKVRGPLAVRALQRDATPWVAASAGNHGLGVAYAMRSSPEPVHVFVPRTSPRVKRDAIAHLGAHVHVVDTPHYDGAEAVARAWAQQHAALFVSPFDDACIMAGNGGTLGLEILEQLPDVATIVVPVGGGGLAAGLACVVRAYRPRVRILGVQSEATPAMHASLQRGAAILEHSGPPTLAEGLEGGVSERSFQYVRRWLDDVLLVPEDAIARAMLWMARQHGERIEGSAAVGLAALLEGSLDAPSPRCIVVTGSNVDAATWRDVERRAGGKLA
jgi:threonine dehydratase